MMECGTLSDFVGTLDFAPYELSKTWEVLSNESTVAYLGSNRIHWRLR